MAGPTRDEAPVKPLLRAAVAGAAIGGRASASTLTFAARPGAPIWQRLVAVGMFGGEVVGDKLPGTPPRTEPGPFAGRVAAGAVTGWRLGAPRFAGALIAAGAAAITTVIGARLRTAAGRDGWGLAAAITEDVLVATAAVAVARPA